MSTSSPAGRSSRVKELGSSSRSPVNPFNFDGGDVRISLPSSTTKKTLTGLVASQAMVLASPVWKKFLFPPWEAIQPDNSNPPTTIGSRRQKEIDFSHDNSDALLVLLNITHLCFSKVPNTQLPYQMLYDLAILCDQYDCLALVRPWVDKWVVYAAHEVKQEGREGWLFIAWAFGREKVFDDLAQLLIKRSPTSQTGECLRYTGEFLPEPMPPGIIESILSARLNTIHSLLNRTYDFIRRYKKSNGKSTVCKRRGKNAEACDSIMYGFAILGLSKLGLWPRKKAGEIHYTVSELVAKLRSLRIDHLPQLGVKTCGLEKSHEACFFTEFGSEINGIMQSIANPVLDSHRVHMKAQRGDA